MYIEVLVEINALDKTFTYYVPENLIEFIKKGIRVEVPFQNRTLEGFVINITDEKPEYDVKSIIDVIDPEPILTDELMELGKFLKESTLSTLISCYQAMLPKALKVSHGTNINKKYQTYIRLINKDYEPKNKQQKELLNMFRENEYIEKKYINTSSLKTLIKNNILEEVKEEVYRLNKKSEKKVNYELNEEQKQAFDNIINSDKMVNLVHGVTGSGKTILYMELIDKVIKEGKTAILLVPEISITEQITSRLLERFDKIAVLHSKLSDGEKYDEYRKISNGEVNIVIGARSAIFAPLKNIGIIIMDEEHTQSFKQDNNPKYHALDVAIKRMEKHNGKIVLGSATPRLETYARALKKVYGMVELKKRANTQELPEIKIVDMNNEVKHGNMLFSNELKNKINEHITSGGQVILLLNRRGYSSFISCKNCGHVIKCPNCDITLTFHKSSNTLRCHYCGYGAKVENICPECNEESLTPLGTGTEKVEEKLNELFPNYKVLRMDIDTTTKKNAHEKMINEFKNHQYDILLGTQMIAKGLDFKDVTLVGVINADTSLNIPDFRSSENTFQLLSQVAGRSGRGEKKGEVIIQTFNKEHYAIDFVKKHDYEGFYEKEMSIRKSLGYPPYYYLTSIKIISKDYNKLKEEANRIGMILRKNLNSTTILGPTVANVFKVNNSFRFQIILKYKKDDNLMPLLTKLTDHYRNTNIKIDIDFNPLNI